MSAMKRSVANFSFYDQRTIEKKLEQMAAEGWMIRKAGNFFWTYEKIQPQKLRFAVTYFPSASEFDPAPSDRQLDKEEFCAQDGWRLVLRWDAMQIFCTDREDAVPIETDPVPYVANIHQTMNKKLTGQLVSIAMVLWMLFLQYSQFQRSPAEYLSHTSRIFTVLFWLLILFGDIFRLCSCFRWQRKAQKAAEDGVFYPVRSNPIMDWGLTIVTVILLAFSMAGNDSKLALMVCMFALFAAAFLLGRWLMKWMKRKGVLRWINLVVSCTCVVLVIGVGMVGIVLAAIEGWIPVDNRKPVDTYEWNGRIYDIYADPLPLEVEDITDVDAKWSKEASWQESVLLAYGEYRQDILLTETVGTYDLTYEITDVKVPALYNFIKNSSINSRQDEVHGDTVFTDHFEPIDPAPWNALEAYQLHWSESILDTYLVCWENRIVEIKFFWEPTDAQIARAADILMP